MQSTLRKWVPQKIKDALRPVAFAVREPRRIARRKAFAMRYYTGPLGLIDAWARQQTEDANFYYELTDLNRAHLAALLSTLTAAPTEQVEAIFAELDGDSALRAHLEQGLIELKLPKDIKIAYGRRLGWYAAVRLLRPEVVVETGVDLGVGSCVVCAALLKNKADGFPGRYYGTDIRPEAGRLLRGAYADAGQILYGDSIQTLKGFTEPIDVFINDSDHSADYEYREYETIAAKLSEQAVILGDNSHVTTSLSQFAMETGRCFVFFRESPKGHWYPGAGIGIAFNRRMLTGPKPTQP